MSSDLFPCPACGFLEFTEAPGSYEICRVCGWEDDHVQLLHPRMRGGANGESLVEAQLEALKQHPLEVKAVQGHVRDPDWRPLTDEEATVAADAPRSNVDYFFAAAGDSPGYYWRRGRR